MSVPATEAAKSLPQQARDGMVKYQGWLYPVLLGALYVVGRVSADRVYRVYGLSTQDVGFGVEDGVTALAILVLLVSFSVGLGAFMVLGVIQLWSGLRSREHKDWGTAGNAAVLLVCAVCCSAWIDGHLEATTATASLGATGVTVIFAAVAVPLTRHRQDSKQVRRGVGLASACLVFFVFAGVFHTSWSALPHERTGASVAGWPTFLVLAPRPRVYTLHTRNGISGLKDGDCVYRFDSHDGLTALWGPVGPGLKGQGRLVGAGIDSLDVGCR